MHLIHLIPFNLSNAFNLLPALWSQENIVIRNSIFNLPSMFSIIVYIGTFFSIFFWGKPTCGKDLSCFPHHLIALTTCDPVCCKLPTNDSGSKFTSTFHDGVINVRSVFNYSSLVARGGTERIDVSQSTTHLKSLGNLWLEVFGRLMM